MKQGTNSRPTGPKPKKPENKIFQYSPKENLEKINKIALKVWRRRCNWRWIWHNRQIN